MSRCVNEECNKNPLKSPDRVLWGCDFDFCCNQECYDKARQQIDHLWGTVAKDDRRFNALLLNPNLKIMEA